MSVSRTGLTVFVATKLVSALNAREHWAARAKRAKVQREAVTLAVWRALHVGMPGTLVFTATPAHRMTVWRITAKPEHPKRVTFTAHVARKMDDDNLRAACKAIRDGLQDCGLIHSDGPESGHTFSYHQRVQKPLGVEITVAVA